MSIPVGLTQRFAHLAQTLASQQGAGSARSLLGAEGAGIAPSAPGAGGAGSASFGDTLKRALDEVSSTQESAQQQVSAFLRGEPVELHQVMAATEEAGIALEMLVEIRNKFTEAYRTVINMQS